MMVAPAFDPVISVDRRVRPKYPVWARKVMYRKLEVGGPDEFSVSRLQQWLHPQQVCAVASGEVIFDYLKSAGMLASCLGARDLEEIRKNGAIFFRHYFAGKKIFGWRSVVRDARGSLFAPYLEQIGKEVFLFWNRLDGEWDAESPALRF